MKKITLILILVLLIGSAFWGYQTSEKKESLVQTEKPENNFSIENFSAYDIESPQKKTKNDEVVEFFLEAKESEWKFSDSQSEEQKTKLWLYNDILAPTLKIKKGQTLKVTLKNSLSQETTIHWHGVRLPNKMDGVPAVTQDAVQPGKEFVYEFTPKDAGSFWFHPHSRGSEQLGRGLYGTLIVEENEKSEKHREYSRDIVWAIDDWRIGDDSQVYSNFGNLHDAVMSGRWGNIITINGKSEPEFKAKKGERIRIRIANTSNARVYRLDFAELDPKIIAVDGMNVKNVFNLSRGFDLSPGNRIDLDLQIPKDFSAKEILVTESFTGQKITMAKIKVSDEIDENIYDFSYPENKNIPDWDKFLEKKVDALYTLDFTGMMMSGNWTINNKTYGNDEPYIFEKNKLHKIRFENKSTLIHPMHIHGQFFKVIAKNGQKYQGDFFRDTILIYPEETVDIIMLTSDEGQWMNHCHIQEHAENGMMTSIIVK